MVLKINITHNIVSVNLHWSINVTGMSGCVNVCPILTDLGQPIFLETLLQWRTVLLYLSWTNVVFASLLLTAATPSRVIRSQQ